MVCWRFKEDGLDEWIAQLNLRHDVVSLPSQRRVVATDAPEEREAREDLQVGLAANFDSR